MRDLLPCSGEPGTRGALGEEHGVSVDLRVIVLWALVPPCLVRSVGSSLSGGSDQGHFLAGYLVGFPQGTTVPRTGHALESEYPELISQASASQPWNKQVAKSSVWLSN